MDKWEHQNKPSYLENYVSRGLPVILSKTLDNGSLCLFSRPGFKTLLLKLIGTDLEVSSQGCSAICILLTNFLSPLWNWYLAQGNWTHKLFLQLEDVVYLKLERLLCSMHHCCIKTTFFFTWNSHRKLLENFWPFWTL